jgi:hypothetical protein
MPRPLLVFLSLALGALCALALVACGSDDEGTIPPTNAQALLDDLEDAQAERDEQDCPGLVDAAGNLITDVEELPDTVDPEVRTALADGAQNLQDLANDESKCEPTGPTGPTGPQTEAIEPTTTDAFTETTTTETTTTEEEKVQPEKPEKVPAQPPGEGQGPPGGVPPGQDGTPPGQDDVPPTGGTEED